MNKLLVGVLATLFCFSVMADDSKHMVTLGSTVNMGWSGTSTTGDVDSSLGIKDFMISKGNLSLNYAYRLSSRFQIGFYLSNENNNTEVKAKAGGKIKSEENIFSIYGVAIYNFSDDFSNAWYVLGGLGKEYNKDETSDTTGGSSDKSESEYDVTGFIFQVGKRFDLKGLGIQNLTYSPSLSIRHGNVGGDLEDAGLNSLTQATLDIIKFDLLF